MRHNDAATDQMVLRYVNDYFGACQKTSVNRVDNFGSLTGLVEERFGTSISVHWCVIFVFDVFKFS